MDHPVPATSLPALSSSTKATTRSAPPLECHLGMVVGACAGMIAEAALEFQRGALTTTTKMRGGNFIYELYKLREFMIADFPDFDRIARTRGAAALCGRDVHPATATALVNEVLDILHKVVRAELN